MATREYPRPSADPFDPRQFSAMLDQALARPGHRAEVNPSTVFVTHDSLTAADDAAIAAQIAAYLYDPLWNLAPEARALRGTVATLRQWADDAEAVVAEWDGLTTAQRFTRLKVVVDRLGKLLDRMADVVTVQGLD